MRSLRSLAGLRVDPIVVRSARAEARELLERAQQRATVIIAEATDEAQVIRERAGLDGLRAGEERAAAEWAALLRAGSESLAMSEREVAALALEIARRFVGEHATLSDAVLSSAATAVLAKARRARRIVLRVHPDDLDRARARALAWLGAGSEPAVLEVLSDLEISRGGVVMECELGRIDARVEARFAAIERALVPR